MDVLAITEPTEDGARLRARPVSWAQRTKRQRPWQTSIQILTITGMHLFR